VPPQNALQTSLAEMICKVLKRDGDIGIADDFFHLGGQSLTAIQLLSVIGHRFGHRPELKDFYRDPTILGLERLIRARTGTDD
jgi:hypothetical protein